MGINLEKEKHELLLFNGEERIDLFGKEYYNLEIFNFE